MKQLFLTSLIALGVTVALANAEPFTYQGVLSDGGVPANGMYDINFIAFDASVGGSSLSAGFAFTNIPVVDGLFEVEVDLGDIFDSNDAWLDLSVRESTGGGFFTDLTPRTKFAATPKAQHATVADTALNVPWLAAAGEISYGDGNDRVYINRSSPITTAEYFGVHANNSGFVGMYVSGPANSEPFYGYSVDGDISAYSWYDSGTDEWRLYSNGGTAFVVDSQRNLVINEDVQADAFQFNAPKTRRIAIAGDTFTSGSDDPYVAYVVNSTGSYIVQAGSGWLLAPVNLPDGATVTKMTVYCTDNSAGGSLLITLSSKLHNGNLSEDLFSVSTSGSLGSQIVLTDTTLGASGIIDYSAKNYRLFVFSSNWPGTSAMGIGSVVIEYTIDEAN